MSWSHPQGKVVIRVRWRVEVVGGGWVGRVGKDGISVGSTLSMAITRNNVV